MFLARGMVSESVLLPGIDAYFACPNQTIFSCCAPAVAPGLGTELGSIEKGNPSR